MTAHKHAHLMALYANDAAETDKPWRRWEYRAKEHQWLDCSGSPMWYDLHDYRRKPEAPRTMTIAGIEVPMPLMDIPEHGGHFYTPILSRGGTAVSIQNYVYERIHDIDIENGMYHRTEEAAKAHAKALIKATKDSIEAADKY